jgi:glycosyltransferase involved in cell wall biosynthesis
MKIRNTTKNTVYIEDIDFHLPYKDGETEEFDPDILKKSKGLRSFIICGTLEVVEYDPEERIEASIMFLKGEYGQTESTESPESPEAPPEEIYISDLDQNSDDIEVRLHGIFYDAGGYGKVNRNLALKLHEAGIKVKVDPKKSQNQLKENELKPIVDLTKTAISRNHISIDSVIPSFAEYSTGKYRILYTTIESYSVPKQFLECCQMYDEIWITSPWSASILKEHVDKPIYVIPAGVNPALYTEDGPRFDFKPNIKGFTFLSVFGWGYRKGYDVLLKAYFEEFSADDDVSLLISSRYQSGSSRFHRNKIRDDIDNIMKMYPNKDMPHVVRYSQVIPEQQMPQLYRAADCFVLPTRGEGSNLCSPEASLCGTPVIMTNVSGQQMYLREDNAFLIEMDHITEMKTGQMHLHYWDGQKFPALTSQKVIDQLKEAMRYIVNHPNEAKKRNKKLQKLIKEEFTWNNTANAAIRRLREIKKEIMS